MCEQNISKESKGDTAGLPQQREKKAKDNFWDVFTKSYFKKKECRLVTKDSRIEEQKQFNFIKSSTMDNNKIAD